MKLPMIILTITFLLVAADVAPCQVPNTQTAVTRDGRTVVLKSDGTWKYSEDSSSPAKKEEAVQITILEVESDQISFVDKPVVISGTLKLASYYNFGYINADATHYSFDLSDEQTTAYVYMKRGKQASELRKRLLAKGGEMKGSFTIMILKERYDTRSSSLHAELIEYKAP